MIVRSYTGRTVAEALTKVRTSLGEGALIIETKPWKTPGLLGGTAGYEVIAAGDDEPATAPAARIPTPLPVAAPTAATTQAAQLDLSDELRAIRRQLARLAAGSGTPVGHLGEELARRCEDSELPGEITAELDDACARAGTRLEPGQRTEFVERLLERGLDRCAPLDWSRTRRLLVVGPTGVGKTTTIAKLAGDLVLNRRLSVGLVTIDTYRVGGQDQLRAYADLLDSPFHVAATPAQLADALAQLADRDVVLIDTAGRNPTDSARVHELKGFCRACPGLSVLLAAPANAGRAEFAAVVERFSVLPIEHVVVTKLDECAAPGRLYGCLRRHRLPVRWFTTGQEVPKDIEAASPAVLAARVVQHEVTELAQ